MIREIILDTETTGLDPLQGHRLVEVAGVELVNHVPTGRTFHSYVNPERDVPEEVVRVHGLTAEFLKDYPTFAEVADPFLAFVETAPLIIHNAAFDVQFLDVELARVGREPFGHARGLCTLQMAQRRFPGAPNSLDALCRRFGVDASARTLHGALLDCQLLAEVYLHLLGGRQVDLDFGAAGAVAAELAVAIVARGPLRPPRQFAPSAAELAAHAAFIARIEGALWQD